MTADRSARALGLTITSRLELNSTPATPSLKSIPAVSVVLTIRCIPPSPSRPLRPLLPAILDTGRSTLPSPHTVSVAESAC